MAGFCNLNGSLFRGPACALAVFFVFIAVFEAEARQVVDRVVAVVNDDVIRLRELNRELEPVRERLESRGLSEEELRKELYEARERILEEMINDKLAEQEIRGAGIKVEQRQVDAAIERIKQRNQYTDEDLRRALQMQGMTMDKYRSEIRRQILRNRLVNRKIKSSVVITDEDVRRYYEEHPEDYGGTIKYRLRNILLQYPGAGASRSKKETKEKMQDITGQLKAGASFVKMARKYSEAPNAPDGGALGKFFIKDLSADLRPVIKKLEKGEFSDIVETKAGFQIFYVEDIVTADPKPLEEVSDEIRNKLYEQRVNEKYSEWIESLRQEAHIRKIR